MSPVVPDPDLSRTDCAAVVLRLFEYVDNEACADDRIQIKAHLDECGACLREYERDLLLKALVRRACEPEAAPRALRLQIMSRISTVSWTASDRTGQQR